MTLEHFIVIRLRLSLIAYTESIWVLVGHSVFIGMHALRISWDS